ncbi:phosphoenolpyruvate--protein phosphotransferase [Calditerrivibrio nitroreducens]|uniref:Phosphoenolpyruvate-protein phosphotransferase n=1 Tax=Calditerrivibrio nitroreducens (strain DSM 19672 / NBRC 101217 / Yu37-1) TaxID=768670 RepID=E4TK52_CALNY|nr:phosphoenolpyruvate--protein phosphotransferase [Calditerrivibrio nitroreducens]ADR19328.1 phosphoenolpyruvate-protein phosphotransferase [Calditerrivibrio nitroreducens DSM 19672]
MNKFKGVAASEGIAIGKAFVFENSKPKVEKRIIPPSKVDAEIEKFKNAIAKTEDYINYTKELSSNNLDADYSFIFDVYLLFLKDTMLVDETINLIKSKFYSSEYALSKVSKNIIASFEASEDEYLRERKHDIEHITSKLLTFMGGDDFTGFDIDSNSIVISRDLSPSQLVYLIHKGISGFATDMGSKVTHTSIIARAVNIPAVVGLSNISDKLETGDIVILDAFDGFVIVNPTDEELMIYQKKKERYSTYIEGLKCDLYLPEVKTLDGHKVNLLLNIEINEELKTNILDISNGIGLYRTEFIYLTRGDVKEDEQFEILKEAVLASKGKPVVIRTFDLGGEKLSSLLPHPEEVNPALGLRAIRYSLRFKDFFTKQLRAILRVANFGDVSIMFPMVSSIHEIIQVKEILDEVRSDLKSKGVPYGDVKTGIMVEIPAAAIMADQFAKYVDFFSVGTNDLTQYTLGVDRNNEYVADIFEPIHPAVLSLLKMIKQAADNNNIEATICGEMAGDPLFIPVLLGLGYRNLSMSPTNILKARYVVTHLTIDKCRELLDRLEESYHKKMHYNILKMFMNEHYKEVNFYE